MNRADRELSAAFFLEQTKKICQNRYVMKRILIYLKEYRLECVLAPAFKMLEACFELIVPLVIAGLIDRGIGLGDKAYIYKMIVCLGLLAAVGLTVSLTAQFFAAKAAIGFATKLRSELFRHLLGLSYAEVDTIGTSTMITRMTSDVNQAQNGVNMFLRLFLRSPFVVFGAMIMAFTIDVHIALIFVAAIAVLFAVVGLIMSRNIPALKRAQESLDKVTKSVREGLNGVRVIRAFRLEADSVNAFSGVTDELTGRQKRAGHISALMNPLTYVLINLGIILVIYSGGVRVSAGTLTQGQVVALYNYMSQILVELVKLANLVVTLNKALASGNRIADVFSIEPSMKEGPGVDPDADEDDDELESAADIGHEAVSFRDVSFIYPGSSEEALENISFVAMKGQTVGIIGGTGSGKSTLAHLIARFYDVTGGGVYLFGHDIRDYSYDQLHSMVGVVMQKAVLFKGTVKSNLSMAADDTDDESILSAADRAQAMDVIKGKGGIDAKVEQGGRNFSGGQRQRLSIARTLAMHTPIVILDDSSSALDYATDLKLRRALKELPPDTTVFIISQRTSSIQHADKILVLDDGRLEGTGTHEELLKDCELYREIHESQLHKQ